MEAPSSLCQCVGSLRLQTESKTFDELKFKCFLVKDIYKAERTSGNQRVGSRTASSFLQNALNYRAHIAPPESYRSHRENGIDPVVRDTPT